MIKAIWTMILLAMPSCAPEVGGKKKSATANSFCRGTASTTNTAPSYDNQQQANSYQMRGGVLTSGFPAVVFLVRRKADELHMCSGTFVGPNTIFTAAHCLDGTENGGIGIMSGTRFDPAVLINGFTSQIKPAKIFYINDPSIYEDENSGAGQDPNLQAGDFAIIVTANANAAPAVAAIKEFRPELNQEFAATVVGYGRDESGKVGNKRMGSVALELYHTSASTEAFANSQSGRSRAEVDQGDSGGGVFLGAELIAVTTNDNNVSIPLFSDRVQKLIAQAKQGGAIIGLPLNAPQASATYSGENGAGTYDPNCN